MELQFNAADERGWPTPLFMAAIVFSIFGFGFSPYLTLHLPSYSELPPSCA